MRRAIAWFLDGVPFDPRSRRAIDETLLDWAHEEESARTAGRRDLATVRGVLAVLRAVVVSSLGEVSRVPAGWIAMRLALFSVVPVVVLMGAPLASKLALFGSLRSAALLLSQIPVGLVWFAPPTIVLALAWRAGGRAFSPVGAAVLVAATMGAIGFCIVPSASHTFAVLYYQSLADAGVVVSATPPSGPAFGQALIIRTGVLACLSGVCVLLAGSLTQRGGISQLGWIMALPAAYLAWLMVLPRAVRLVWYAPQYENLAAEALLLVAAMVATVRLSRPAAGGHSAVESQGD